MGINKSRLIESADGGDLYIEIEPNDNYAIDLDGISITGTGEFVHDPKVDRNFKEENGTITKTVWVRIKDIRTFISLSIPVYFEGV